MMRRKVTLTLGEFGHSALDDQACSLWLSVHELVRRAAEYYLEDGGGATRPGYRVPSRLIMSAGESRFAGALEVSLDLAMWRRLGAEAHRQEVSLERLLRHAVLYLVADLVSGRVADRFAD
jgi:hypothetical protein